MSDRVILPRRATSEDQDDRTGATANAHDDSGAQQETLPPLRWLLQPTSDRFAHPAEIELANLLGFYGIRWAYEPTTFAVRWGSDGRPHEFVTPDFYLPDHDLYLELTTMRQRLVTRKNRKIRLLREHYPNVRVRLLYLRDLERLRSAHLRGGKAGKGSIGTTVFAERDVVGRIDELGQELIRAWTETRGGHSDPRPLLLGIGAGSGRFLEALGASIRDRGYPVDLDLVAITPAAALVDGRRARVMRQPVEPVAARPVTIVQEVLSTGLSAAFLENWLRRRGATSVEVCALLDRQVARVVDVPVVCSGFAAPDVSLAGFGLARWRAFRHLPYIAAVDAD
jgi:hypoxanthine-guanine phosphoribosyltransferase